MGRWIKKCEAEGKSPAEPDGFGVPMLVWSASGNFLDACQYLVEKWGADVDGAADISRLDGARDGLTRPMHAAANAGALAVVRYLHSQGAALDEPDAHGLTPLTYACFKGCADVVGYLIENGADPTRSDEQGRSVRENCLIGKQCAILDSLHEVDEEVFDTIAALLDGQCNRQE